MSIVAVHSYQMYGPGGGIVTDVPQITTVPVAGNAMQFTFAANGSGHVAPATELVWAFSGPGTPSPTTGTGYGPITVTGSTPNAQISAVLTVTGTPGTPPPGTYTEVVRTGSGAVPREMEQATAAEQAAPANGEEWDPADYTVAEIIEYVDEHPDEAADILAAEQAGKNRSTLISHLESLIG